MKKELHTVNIPAEDYEELTEFYKTKGYYDQALTIILKCVPKHQFVHIKHKFKESGLDVKIQEEGFLTYLFKQVKPEDQKQP